MCSVNTYSLVKLQSLGIQRTKKHSSIRQLGCGIWYKNCWYRSLLCIANRQIFFFDIRDCSWKNVTRIILHVDNCGTNQFIARFWFLSDTELKHIHLSFLTSPSPSFAYYVTRWSWKQTRLVGSRFNWET